MLLFCNTTHMKSCFPVFRNTGGTLWKGLSFQIFKGNRVIWMKLTDLKSHHVKLITAVTVALGVAILVSIVFFARTIFEVVQKKNVSKFQSSAPNPLNRKKKVFRHMKQSFGITHLEYLPGRCNTIPSGRNNRALPTSNS